MSMPQAKAKSCRKKAAHHAYGRPPTRWPSKVVDGFRKMLVGLFPFNPRPPTVTFPAVDVDRSTTSGRSGGGGDHVPKRSPTCNSNLQPVNAHYDEAITDCVEFFHKSARVDAR